ncbi:hypothetical protein H0R92_10485 [Treponema sp. OMZ 840]|uniref:TP0183 family DNA metabolism protein n=1 Tax=Treponema sp. OMZ 840 TaxID=244313 RepID=UPI003D90577F
MIHGRQYRLQSYILFFILFFLCIIPLYAQEKKTPLYFYAHAASEKNSAGDPAVIKMTQDLLFSQLIALDIFTVYDKRDTEYSPAELQRYKAENALLFYANIYEKNGQWLAELSLIEAASGKETVIQNNYAGYYKILMEAKNSLHNLIKEFKSASYTQVPHTSAAVALNAESLSGTWYGEEHIDKIILLRGGRGFVIFKNGASMNITITISGKSLTAVQQSKPNASFFPEIPREAALINAPDAAPIRWELTIENESSMQGIKLSLIAEYDDNGKVFVKPGAVPVRWHR